MLEGKKEGSWIIGTTSAHREPAPADNIRKLGPSIFLGLLSSLFFAVTFVLNQRMAQTGGSWEWSASLRYLFMFPMLLIVVLARGTLRSVLQELARAPNRWLIWSTVGFGLFYIPICVCAKYAPSWLVAATWQFTIIAGSLLSPLFRQAGHHAVPGQRHRIPVRGLMMSLVIFGGIVLVELGHTSAVHTQVLWLTVILMGVGTFAYPLGNRKMMEVSGGRLAALERVFGMTVASLPLWLGLSAFTLLKSGPPTQAQVLQCVVVALSSGVIATALFFAATDRTRGDVRHLAAVEATQSGEVVFTVLLGVLFTNTRMPSWISLCGIVVIVLGMVGHSLSSKRNLKEGGGRGPGPGCGGTQSGALEG